MGFAESSDVNNQQQPENPTAATPQGVRSVSRREAIRAAIGAVPVVLLLTTRAARAEGSAGSGEGSGAAAPAGAAPAEAPKSKTSEADKPSVADPDPGSEEWR